MAISDYQTNIKLTDDPSGGMPDLGTRYQGGSNRASSPFVKGWFQVFFGLPQTIFNGGLAPSTVNKYLTSTAISFTPPGDPTVNYADIQGQGGVDSSVITGVTIDRSFSLVFNEQYGTPIWRIFEAWCGYFNPYLGVSTVGNTFAGKEYKGEVWVIQTRPVFKIESGSAAEVKAGTVEKVFVFDGVFPTNNPLSSFDSNVQGGETVQLTINFRFDGRPITELTDPAIIKTAETLLNGADLFRATADRYTRVLESETAVNGLPTD